MLAEAQKAVTKLERVTRAGGRWRLTPRSLDFAKELNADEESR